MSMIIQADYKQLEQVAQRFRRSTEHSVALRDQLRRAFTPLEEGGWVGRGSTAFCTEMQSAVFPALERLIATLQDAEQVTLTLRTLLQQAEEEAAAPFRGGSDAAPTNEATPNAPGFWERWGEWVHGALDVLGLIPVVGEVADGVNGLIYLGEGRYVEAGISAVAMIPLLGDLGKAGKWTVKGGKVLVEELAETGLKRALREGVETLAEREVREGAETLLERGAREGLEATRFGALAPNTRYVRNGYEYLTDEAGKVIRVSGDLKLETAPRTLHQTEVGHMGLPGDEGGHLIGSQFGGTPEGVNLVPQNGWLNRGKGSHWTKMEREWAEALRQGKPVKVDIVLKYPPGETMRPSTFQVGWQVNGLSRRRFFPNRKR